MSGEMSEELAGDRVIEASIRAKEEKIAEGRAILEDYADLYEDDPGV
jgi:hypothetical protein